MLLIPVLFTSSIESYKVQAGFDGLAFLECIGHFFTVFFGAFALGAGMGCVTALLTKYTRIQDFPLLETSLFVLMSYGTFLAAEAAGLTGIVAVLFCGICQAHYTYNNLSPESQARTKEVFELLNFLMENFVFTYIGVSVFTFRKHNWDPGFIPLSFVAILVGRVLNIYPLSFLLNLGRSNKINYNFQHMMMFSGLRGAMAFALAMRGTKTDAGCVILSTTLIIVIATVILCGGLTTQVLQWLKIRVGVEEEMELQTFDSMHTSDQLEQPQGGRLAGKAFMVKIWYGLDARLIKPLLTHARPPLTETMPKCCLPLSRILTTTEQLIPSGSSRNGSMSRHDEMDECIIGEMDQIQTIMQSSPHDPFSASHDAPSHDESNATLLTRVRVPGPTGVSL